MYPEVRIPTSFAAFSKAILRRLTALALRSLCTGRLSLDSCLRHSSPSCRQTFNELVLHWNPKELLVQTLGEDL
jgi:hypothetical protein